MQRLRTALALAVTVVALLPAAARADSNIWRDCNLHGHLTQAYTQKQYNAALAHPPTDISEYTDCVDIVRRAQLAAAGGGPSSGSGGASSSAGAAGTAGGGGGFGGGAGGAAAAAGGSDPKDATQALQAASPADRAAVERAMQAAPLDADGKPIDLSKSTIGSLGSIPTPLFIVLVVLALAAGAGGGAAVTHRVRRRSPAV